MPLNQIVALKAFIIGSSYFVVMWPFLYLSLAKNARPESNFEFLFVPLVLPFVFGVVNILVVGLSQRVLPHKSQERYWIFGMLYGLGLSLYGNFGKDIPVGLFGLPDSSIQYAVIPVAMVLYGLIFRYILKNLNELFLK